MFHLIQKFASAIFKKLNLIKEDDFDATAVALYFEKQFEKEIHWLETTKNAFKQCRDVMTPHYAEIQKRANFTKEQCNVKYSTILICIDLQLFHVSEKVIFLKYETSFF